MWIAMRVAAMAVLTMLGACATTPTSTSYDRAANNIRGIAIQPPGFPDKPGAQVRGGSGVSFSMPFSGSKDDDYAENPSDVAREVQTIFNQNSYDYERDMQESLQSAFAKAGMPTFMVRGERPLKDRSKFMTQCPPVPGADACLDIYVTFVGFTAVEDKNYVPTVQMSAKLVRMSDRATLFEDQIVYNPVEETSAVIVAQPSGKHKFADSAAMRANPRAVTAAVQEAVKSVTMTLVEQFR